MFRSVLPLSLLFGMTLTACGRGGSSGLGNTIDTAGGTGTTNTGNTNTGNTNTGNTGTGNTGTGNTGFSCSDGPTDPEQLFADEFVSLYTRTTNTPYTTDAGVGAIVDALSGQRLDVREQCVPIDIVPVKSDRALETLSASQNPEMSRHSTILHYTVL